MPKLKELFTTPASWTKGSYARDAQDSPVSSLNVDAVCWCLKGALNYCYLNDDAGYVRAEQKILSELRARGYEGENLSIIRFNDQVQFDDVRELVNLLDI